MLNTLKKKLPQNPLARLTALSYNVTSTSRSSLLVYWHIELPCPRGFVSITQLVSATYHVTDSDVNPFAVNIYYDLIERVITTDLHTFEFSNLLVKNSITKGPIERLK